MDYQIKGREHPKRGRLNVNGTRVDVVLSLCLDGQVPDGELSDKEKMLLRRAVAIVKKMRTKGYKEPAIAMHVRQWSVNEAMKT